MEHLIDARSAMASRLVTVLVASASVALAACGGSSPSATASPIATPASALDACLVGTWRVVGQTQNSPANDEAIKYSGGEDEVFTIDAQGGVTIDTHAAKPVVFVSAGDTFTATVAGTGRGTLSTSILGANRVFDFKPSADDTRTTHSFGPNGAELGPARPDTAFSAIYTCAPGRFTFYKSAVSYMIDGPIVELTAGTGNASSTASPTPS
jgi:ABC-type Fe3+-hydroxamate transport system substrate-binding protein